MERCNDDCSRCYLKGKALCPNKIVVIHSDEKVIRGRRSELPFVYDDFLIPQEIIDEVLKPFIKKGIDDE
jgi:hypothetical protein